VWDSVASQHRGFNRILSCLVVVSGSSLLVEKVFLVHRVLVILALIRYLKFGALIYQTILVLFYMLLVFAAAVGKHFSDLVVFLIIRVVHMLHNFLLGF